MARGRVRVIVRIRRHHKGHVGLPKMVGIKDSSPFDDAPHQDPCQLCLESILTPLQCGMIMVLPGGVPVLAFAVIDNVSNDANTLGGCAVVYLNLVEGSTTTAIDVALVENGTGQGCDGFCVSDNALGAVISLDLGETAVVPMGGHGESVTGEESPQRIAKARFLTCGTVRLRLDIVHAVAHVEF